MTTEYILSSRYLRGDEKTFDDVAKRVADAIGDTPDERAKFFEIMIKKKFVPGGRTIACAGTDKVLIPNCVVLPVEDSLDEIFRTLQRASILQQAGCVTGNTQILTDKGYVRISEHVGEILNVWNGLSFTPAEFKLTKTQAEVFNITLNTGQTMTCTADHAFLTPSGTKLLSELHKYSQLSMCEYPVMSGQKELPAAYTQGFYSGYSGYGDKSIKVPDAFLGKLDMLAYLHADENNIKIILPNELDKDFVPNTEYTLASRTQWIDGLIDAAMMNYAGRVKTITITHDYDFLTEVQLQLLTLNVKSFLCFSRGRGCLSIPIYEHHKLRNLGCQSTHLCSKEPVGTSGIDFALRISEISKCDLPADVYDVSVILDEDSEYDSSGPEGLSDDLPSELLKRVRERIHDDRRACTYNGIYTHNCGLGFNFSKLRPARMPCVRTGGSASGPISFLGLYAHAFKIVQQYNRSGANMGVLSVEHPDILAFIHIKDDLKRLTNFNISVLLTDRFMKQLNEAPDSLWYCDWQGTPMKPRYIEYTPELLVEDVSEADVTVKDLFEEIVLAAWSTGEPGILFQDNINRNNLLKDILGDITCVNPCGEIPLYDNECCNLGSINLEEFVVDGKVDFDDLRRTVRIAIVFMNNVIDKLHIPDKELSENVRLLRRLGLGVMGLHDMLIKLHLPYASEEGRELIERVFRCIDVASSDKSQILVAKYGSVAERLLRAGKATPEQIPEDSYLWITANCARMCIAPTGSTSIIHTVSSGIEPYFSLAYRRTIKGQLQDYIFVNKQLERYLQSANLDRTVLQKIIDKGIQHVDEIPKDVRRVFATAQEISPQNHILMQAAAQKHVDNSISKTINFVGDSTPDDISQVLLLAHQLGCKGCTVYRDGCRDSQVFQNTSSTSSTTKKQSVVNGVKMCSSGSCDL